VLRHQGRVVLRCPGFVIAQIAPRLHDKVSRCLDYIVPVALGIYASLTGLWAVYHAPTQNHVYRIATPMRV
jgi:hypothetical protein